MLDKTLPLLPVHFLDVDAPEKPEMIYRRPGSIWYHGDKASIIPHTEDENDYKKAVSDWQYNQCLYRGWKKMPNGFLKDYVGVYFNDEVEIDFHISDNHYKADKMSIATFESIMRDNEIEL
jgi:hypothetical protein